MATLRVVHHARDQPILRKLLVGIRLVRQCADRKRRLIQYQQHRICRSLERPVMICRLPALLILAILVVTLVAVALQPGGLEQVHALVDRLQDPTWLEKPAQPADLVRSPLILSVAFLVFAILVPLIEEAVKTIGVPLRAYRRPGLAQAFLWGLAGGAGFALAEGLFNSLGGFDAWAATVTLRVGATLRCAKLLLPVVLIDLCFCDSCQLFPRQNG